MNKSSKGLQGKVVPLAFFNIFVLWGSTFLAIEYGLKGFPPFLLSALRFIAAGLILLVFQLMRGERFGTWKDWLWNSVSGLLVLTVSTGLVCWGEQFISSSEAAVIEASAPFWFIALDKVNWRHYFSDRFIPMGLIIGFGGLIIFCNGSFKSSAATGISAQMRTWAYVAMIFSSLAWVLGSLALKKAKTSGSMVMNTAQQLIMGGISSIIVSKSMGEMKGFSFGAVPVAGWGGLIFLVFFGSIAAFMSYAYLLKMRPPAMVSVHTYINPVVAVLVGWIFTGSKISGFQLLGLAVILFGVVLTNATAYKPGVRKRAQMRLIGRSIRHTFHYSETSRKLAGEAISNDVKETLPTSDFKEIFEKYGNNKKAEVKD